MDLKTAKTMLQLRDSFTDDEIKKQYRKLSKVFHPDSPTGSQEHFELLTQSKDYLLSKQWTRENSQNRSSTSNVQNHFDNINKKYQKVRYMSKGTLLNIVDLW